MVVPVVVEMVHMELRHLRYFLAIVAERHFTRAAKVLGIAQPPLSQQIRQLEEEVGVALFTRTARGVTLTAAGEAFLPHAEAALREADRARTAARRIRHGDLGTIRVGFTSAASLNPLVSGAISAFRNTYPDVELRLIVQPTASLLVLLSQDQIDVAFVRPTSTERQSLRAIPLPDERLWIALPSGHVLAARKLLRLDDLRNEPFILYPRANGSLLYDSIIAACQSAGFSPRVVQEAPQMASMVSLVAAGVGVTLVPESVCQLRPAGVRYVRINGQAPVAMLWLVAQQSATGSAVDNFLRHAATFFKTPPPADDLNAVIHTKYQSMTFYILDVCNRRRYSRLGAARRHEQAIAGSGSMRHIVSVCSSACGRGSSGTPSVRRRPACARRRWRTSHRTRTTCVATDSCPSHFSGDRVTAEAGLRGRKDRRNGDKADARCWSMTSS